MIFSKRKTTILIAMIALISIAASGFVLARELQVDYPQDGPTTTSIGLEGYINYIYKFIIGLAGVIAFGALVVAGFQYLTSAGNPQAMNDAKSQMTGAIIGLLLLLGSHILLSTINPRLVNLSPGALKPSQGICLYEKPNAKGDFICYSGSSKHLPKNFEPESIEIISPRYTETPGGQRYQASNNINWIYGFNNKDWEPSSGDYDDIIDNSKKTSSDSNYVTGVSSSMESFYIQWGTPGIYLYKDPYSGGSPSFDFPNSPYQVLQSDNSELITAYNNNVEAISFKPLKCLKKSSGYCPEVKYGAVLHEKSSFEGECSIAYGGLGSAAMGASYCGGTYIDNLSSNSTNFPKPNSPPAYKHPIGNNNLSSVTVFNHACHGNSSGKITFYEQTNRAGDYFEVPASDISGYKEMLNIDYSSPTSIGGYSIQDGDDALPDNEMNEILSMKVEGDFLVVLTRQNDLDGHCQTNRETVSTFNGKYVLRGDDDAKIRSIAIIPVQ